MTKNKQTQRLFRGRNTKNNMWIYGYYFVNRGKNYIVWDGFVDNPLDTPEDYEVAPDSVGQSTGLQDKNGVEIYEGDVLCDSGGNKGVVVWFQGNVQYILNDMCEYVNGNYYEPAHIIDSVRVTSEIIGNIHSNPEMLSD